jgi:hypothetical protein
VINKINLLKYSLNEREKTMKSITLILALFLVLLSATVSSAIPALQIYLEGATYDTTSETWVLNTSSDTFTLWVLGDISHYGSISDVKLAAAVATSELSGGSIALASTTASGITDPSTPVGPVFNVISADGAVPTLGDGSPLAPHGIYGAGTSFFEWSLGDFTLIDSPIGDFITAYPTSFSDMGQINAYNVTASGFTSIHFDAYDHFIAGNSGKYKYDFAPFSHDGEGNQVPEPSALWLVGMGLLGMGFFGRKNK